MWCWWPTHQLHKVTSVSTITVYDNSIHRTHYVAKATLRVPVSAGKWVFYFLSSDKKNIYTVFLQQQNQTHPIQLYTKKKLKNMDVMHRNANEWFRLRRRRCRISFEILQIIQQKFLGHICRFSKCKPTKRAMLFEFSKWTNGYWINKFSLFFSPSFFYSLHIYFHFRTTQIDWSILILFVCNEKFEWIRI